MKRLAIAVGIALLLAIVAPRAGYPHGEASWIMENPETAYCCGPHDCDRLPKSAVKITATGYLVTIAEGVMATELISYGKELQSRDDDYWACITDAGIRCFFAPPMGV